MARHAEAGDGDDAVGEACRLCGSTRTSLLYEGGRRSHGRQFHHCTVCDLVFVPDRFLLTPAQERERYLHHENDPADARYRAFLARLMDEVAPLVELAAEGLDYGCGEPPVLVMMLREAGLRAVGWDLFFRRNDAALQRTYDFITCSETAEHFREPMREMRRLGRLLRPGGVLGVMTAMLDDRSQFGGWHYHHDETHISFFSRRTMTWIARHLGWGVGFPRANVTVFRAPH